MPDRSGGADRRPTPAGQAFAAVVWTPSRREQVPREPRTFAARAHNRCEHTVVVVERNVLEEVAEVEAIERPRPRALDELLHRHLLHEAIEILANRVEMLLAQGARQRLTVRMR